MQTKIVPIFFSVTFVTKTTNRLAFPMEMRGGLAHILEFLFYLYFGECLNHITRLQVVVINK